MPDREKRPRSPVRSLHARSHVPSRPQNAAKVRGFSLTASGFTAETDWLLEESGFEPSVPLGEKRSFRNASIRELDVTNTLTLLGTLGNLAGQAVQDNLFPKPLEEPA